MLIDQQSQQYPYTKSYAAVPIRNQSAKNFNHCESKPGPSLPSKNKICPKANITGTNLKQNSFKDKKETDIQGSKVVVEPTDPKVAASSTSQGMNPEPVVKSVTSVEIVDVSNKR